jgi:DNA-binding transcriptional MerR regulator
LAIIRYWQEAGLLSLEEIGDILAGPTANRAWKKVVEDRLEALTRQIEQMTTAREFLEHVIS